MRKKTPAASAHAETAVTSLDEHRLVALRAEIDALTPAFARAVAEEDRLYGEIHALQTQIHEIEHRGDPAGTYLIYPEISDGPITITVRTAYEQKKVRFSIGDDHKMSHAGLYPYAGSIAKRIADGLNSLGADATADPRRCVSVLTDEERAARLTTWAEEAYIARVAAGDWHDADEE